VGADSTVETMKLPQQNPMVQRTDTIIQILTFCAVIFYSAPLALAVGEPHSTTAEGLNQALSRGVVPYPIHKGERQRKIALTFLDVDLKALQKQRVVKQDGWAFTGAITYGLSEHWGIGFTGAYCKLSGPHSLNNYGSPHRHTPFNSPKLPYDKTVMGDGSGEAYAGLVSLIWDYRTGDKFRLPIYFGTGYMSVKARAENRQLGLKVTGEVHSAVLHWGFAPSFNLSKFRTVLFFMRAEPLDPGKGEIVDYNPTTGEVNNRAESKLSSGGFLPKDAGLAALGLEFTYKPWGLGFTYIPPREGASAYGLKWTHRWGGSDD